MDTYARSLWCLLSGGLIWTLLAVKRILGVVFQNILMGGNRLYANSPCQSTFIYLSVATDNTGESKLVSSIVGKNVFFRKFSVLNFEFYSLLDITWHFSSNLMKLFQFTDSPICVLSDLSFDWKLEAGLELTFLIQINLLALQL